MPSPTFPIRRRRGLSLLTVGTLVASLLSVTSVVAGAAGAAGKTGKDGKPGTQLATSASLLQPELVIRPKPDNAADLGVTTSSSRDSMTV